MLNTKMMSVLFVAWVSLSSLPANALPVEFVVDAIESVLKKEEAHLAGKTGAELVEHEAALEGKETADLIKEAHESLQAGKLSSLENNKNFWNKVVSTYGAKTHALSDAYVYIEISADKKIIGTTNYVKAGAVSAPVLLAPSDVFHTAKDAQHFIARLTGENDVSALKKIHVKLTGSADLTLLYDPVKGVFNQRSSAFNQAQITMQNGEKVTLENFDNHLGSSWRVKLNTCCVYSGIPPSTDIWNALKKLTFNKNNVQVISLFDDSETANIIRKIKSPNNIAHPDQIKGNSIEAINALVQAGEVGSPLVIIGHVDNGNIVVEGSNGYSINIESIAAVAKTKQRMVIWMGCNTADVKAADAGVTTLNKIYPKQMAEGLVAALSNPKNMQDFYAKLSNKNVIISIPNKVYPVANISGRAAVSFMYGRANNVPVFRGVMAVILPTQLEEKRENGK